jgi:concentrative nucleoside transporter, CNT family
VKLPLRPRTCVYVLVAAVAALLLLQGGEATGDSGSDGDSGERAAAKPAPAPSTGAARLGTNFKPSEGGVVRFRGLLGYFTLLLIAWGLSKHRKQIRWRPVAWGLGLQVLLALIVLNPVVSQFFFEGVDRGVRGLLGFAGTGIDFVFQSTVPHKVTYIDGDGKMVTQLFIGQISPVMKNFAFWILPTVIFFSSLITVLYHLGIMQWIVKGLARAMVFAMGTSGAETLSCTANIFVGQTEAPLLIKPFVGKMTESELMAVMTGGFATVAGGVLAIYVNMLQGVPGIAGHLVTASIMAAPCALAVSKLMLPETGEPVTGGKVEISVERPDSNVIEAAARGASEGMTLVLNIAAMLIGFVALMALVNALLGLLGAGIGSIFNVELNLSLQMLLGWALSPLAWAMGVPWDEAGLVGQLLGEKLVLTELLAYLHLKSLLTSGTVVLSERSAVIASYALCGFANVASIGIQIGGIGGIAPERRGDLARLGLRAMGAGALVSCLSGTIAGMLV